MKSILTLVAAVCALSAAGAANACGAPCPAPSPSTPSPSPTPAAIPSSIASSSLASSEASSRATAGAQAGAVGIGSGGDAKASGGSAAGGSSSLADNSTSRALALSLFVQPPVFTPPMAQVACASANVRQEASSGWIILGGYSSANSTTDSSDCTLLNIRNAMVKECKYASAKQVEDLLVQKHLPKFTPNAQAYTKAADDPGYVDYTPTQCAVLLTPPAPPPKLVMLQDLAPPAAGKPPEAPPKKAKRNGKADTRASSTKKDLPPSVILNECDNPLVLRCIQPRKTTS